MKHYLVHFDGYSYHIYSNKVEKVHTQTAGYIGIDSIEWTLTEEAVKFLYKNRAIINEHFR